MDLLYHTNIRGNNYRFENWNRFRAFFRPHFFLSTVLESRVKKPALFKIVRKSLFTSKRALEIPCFIAPACPEIPPPFTFTAISYFPNVLVRKSGCFIIILAVSREKYSSRERLFIIKAPCPSFSQTRAIEVFRFPVAQIYLSNTYYLNN